MSAKLLPHCADVWIFLKYGEDLWINSTLCKPVTGVFNVPPSGILKALILCDVRE